MKKGHIFLRLFTFLLIIIFVLTLITTAYAVPMDENFDDDLFLNEGGNFTNDGILYTLGGTISQSQVSNDISCPLGDNGSDYYLIVGTDTSLTISLVGTEAFQIVSFSIDAWAEHDILITPSTGSPVTLVSNQAEVTQTVDLSSNDDFKNITSFTISGQNLLLCLDDLNFEAPVLPTYTVTYNGNGNTGGSVPTDGNNYPNGNTVTVLGNTGSLVRTGYTFAGWNTAANGSGTSYTGGNTFSIGTSNVTLYAQWTAIDYTITYNGNT
ncbi:MAG: InlB B-repeat-containing protein, partial [Clostridia bacterium]|nr:InlB B-repeat-containing protein [Clostridia bacterium]